MVAVSAAKHNVALQNVAPTAKLWLSKSMTHTADGVSASSVMKILMNVYTRVLMCMSEKVAKSEHLTISIDGTSDVRERNPIAVRMTGEILFSLLTLLSPLLSSYLFSSGVYKMNQWSLPLHFCEPGDHKASTQLHEIERIFNTINTFNRRKEVRFYWGFFLSIF